MSTVKHILIADDNAEIREILRVLLESEGYRVSEACDGDEAVQRVQPDTDLIVLDVMMPGKSGFTACAEIREKSAAPILFLTALSQDSDKMMAFSSGSDDYLTKPFSYAELVSRVKALLRRYYVYKGKEESAAQSVVEIGALSLCEDTREVRLADTLVTLTDIEFRILLLLARNRKKIFSAQNIYESVWEEPYFYSCNNTVMVHIRNLRSKLEVDPQNPKYIRNVWGKGYRIE